MPLILQDSKARKLEKVMLKLGLDRAGGIYEYEEPNGTKVVCKFVGIDGLNLKFILADGSENLAPIVDMGDGSLVTDYLRRL